MKQNKIKKKKSTMLMTVFWIMSSGDEYIANVFGNKK